MEDNQSNESRVYDFDKDSPKINSPILNQDLSMSIYGNYEDDEASVDSVLCAPGSRLAMTGFMHKDCTENFVMFVNAGSGTLKEGDSVVEFKPDICYQGGDVFKTDANITDGGDYPSIYQSARRGNFCYEFKDVLPGDYFIDLHFVEIIYTNGPKGMRVFNVFAQEEKILSELDIFSIVGAHKPLQLVDARVSVGENGTIVLKFEGVHGSPLISGICIRRATKLSVPDLKPEFLVCNNCSSEIEAPKINQLQQKATARYEKKIQELTHQCQLKANECYEAWMSLTAANEKIDKIRIELGDKLCQVHTLDQTVEKQTEKLKDVSCQYERDKKTWFARIHDLDEKIKIMKKEQSQLSYEAHECADSVPELNKMVFAVQALVAQCEDLKWKYSEEQAKRKMLHNQVQEAKGNIRVFCRCRPLSKEETSARYSTVVDFNAAKDGDLGVLTAGSTKKTFKFDRVYSPNDDQVEVFVDASPMVVSVLDGYNVCIFAYGQTGTGKTFTMEGTEHNRGVNYRTLEELFKIAKERNETFSYNISVSVLEVYNEQIRDLLATSPSSKKLEIRQASEGVHHVPGIVEAKVENIRQVWDVLQAGSNARAVGSNNVNEHSSRSHCMLCIMVKSKNLINGETTNSKLWLVDLAGSERLAKTDAQGDRLKEAQNINRSLSALGDVISALANKSSHIPYRNSKLTHLLQDSLGGDSKTLMFVQISPSENDLGETLSSLNFATRVRGVELGPAKRQVDTGELQKLKTMLERSRQESRLKEESLHKVEVNLQSLESKVKSKDQICKNQQDKVKELEGQLNSNIELYKQLDKQLSQTLEKLKGKEEAYATVQLKIRDLENKIRDREHSEALALQKVKELENKLNERARSQSDECLLLQQKVKELEKREQDKDTEMIDLQKVKELENKLNERVRSHSDECFVLQQKVKELEKREQDKDTEMMDLRNKVKDLEERKRERFSDASMLLRSGDKQRIVMSKDEEGEFTNEIETPVLRNSNSINRPPRNDSSDLLKGPQPLRDIRRKRGSLSSETENHYGMTSNLYPEKRKIQQAEPKKAKPSEPPSKPFVSSRVTRPTIASQRLSSSYRLNRDQAITTGIKEKDKTRGWSR
ncbi:Kinesin-like protein KIN-14R [Ranunculus cassubicifolius]